MEALALQGPPQTSPPPPALPPPPPPPAVLPPALSPAAQLSPAPMPIASTTCGMIPLKFEKPVYSSPPPATSNPENNTCRMIDYRGAKIAAFGVDGRELVCLPQAFDLFLKHLVGGLHTVYTKLKRLDITPIVCNVEQVRILRGLGAIQPGVNRCKLISPKEFDILYEDCTNSSARPGRPPKRSTHMATPETLEKLKKSRMDNGESFYSPQRLLDPKKSPLFGNGYHYPPHLASMSMPFMPLGHPMMSMAMANHMGLRPDAGLLRSDRHTAEMDLSTHRSVHRPKEEKYEDHMSSIEDNNNKPLDKPLNLEMEKHRDRRHSNTDKESGSSYFSFSGMSTPSEGMVNGQLDLSTRGMSVASGNEDLDDDSDDDKDDDDDLDDMPTHQHQPITNGETADKISSQTTMYAQQMLNADSGAISSVETLLMNIQGLLKVAAENARHRERQINYEKAELKVELMRERELRETIEKQMQEEQRTRAALQKRLKKEKKARRRLQEHVEQLVEQPQKKLTPPPGTEEQLHKPPTQDSLRMLTESLAMQERERERNVERERERQREGEREREQRERERERERTGQHSPDEDHRMAAAYDARSGLQNLMESFLSSQKTQCNGAPNGYVHSPVIKQAESV